MGFIISENFGKFDDDQRIESASPAYDLGIKKTTCLIGHFLSEGSILRGMTVNMVQMLSQINRILGAKAWARMVT